MNALNRVGRSHDWRTSDITAALVEEATESASEPEGVSFLVLTENEAQARSCAPLLARRLHPERTFGDILHVERVPRGFEVVLRAW